MKYLRKFNESSDNMESLTASDLIDKRYENFDELDSGDIWSNIEDLMIEFAKFHVEAALKAASEDSHTKDVPYTNDVEVDRDSILSAYPLENIK